MGKRWLKWWMVVLTGLVLVLTGGPTYYIVHKHGGVAADTKPSQPFDKVATVAQPKDRYDVVVVGTDPEGVMAAVSAARNGLSTLLVDGKGRTVLGGLMTVGWLNTIDLDQDKDKAYLTITGQRPPVLNKGLFSEWFAMVEGTSFDIHTAANAFNKMVQNEKNIEVVLQVKAIEPLMGAGGKAIEGVSVTTADGLKHTVHAGSVIDATQDADIAAAAGVPYTVGHEDLGDSKARMAVTAVFKIGGVDTSVWQKVRNRLAEDGDPYTGADDYSANGYGNMKTYPAVDPKRARMRGLNIGRQNDNSALINALQIYGVDPFDPASLEQAKTIARTELPHVLAYMKQLYPEFADTTLIGIAPELYVRESRHIEGMYRLGIVDVLDNRDQWDRIAFGSYRVDIQSTGPTDPGQELVNPYKYAIPFRSIVPQKVDGLLVVGRSASYDSLAAGTARVIPNGMAEGQAAGVAAKLAKDGGVTFRQLANDHAAIAKLQELLNAQGMDLKPFKTDPTDKNPNRPSLAYMLHKDYPGLKYAVYLDMTSASGDNDFQLDEPSNVKRLANGLKTVRKKYGTAFPSDPDTTIAGIDTPEKQPLTLDQASYMFAKTMGLSVTREQAAAELEARGLLTKATVDGIVNKASLTNGEVFMILRDVLTGKVGLKL